MKNLNLAIHAAIKGRGDKKYHLGVIAKRADGSFVSSNNIRAQFHSPTAHAESRVLKRAGKGCTLWIGRVLADGSWAMAKPCKECMKMIRLYKVKKIYYTISENEYGVMEITK